MLSRKFSQPSRRAELLGEIIMILNDQSDDWLSVLHEELLHPFVSPLRPHLKLVQSFFADRARDNSPVAGMVAARNGEGVPT